MLLFQIVILDEAHNIEDSARSAASWEVTRDEIKDAMDDLERLMQLEVAPAAHRDLGKLCSSLLQWIDGSADNLSDYSGSEEIFGYITTIIRMNSLNPEALPMREKKFFLNLISGIVDQNNEVPR